MLATRETDRPCTRQSGFGFGFADKSRSAPASSKAEKFGRRVPSLRCALRLKRFFYNTTLDLLGKQLPHLLPLPPPHISPQALCRPYSVRAAHNNFLIYANHDSVPRRQASHYRQALHSFSGRRQSQRPRILSKPQHSLLLDRPFSSRSFRPPGQGLSGRETVTWLGVPDWGLPCAETRGPRRSDRRRRGTLVLVALCTGMRAWCLGWRVGSGLLRDGTVAATVVSAGTLVTRCCMRLTRSRW
ncbi:hypothetical protein IWX49DRAFT_202716 [Phyllosticta citricarpa]|uniref:Uncharacterized protein n=1 Tax=Phyllosticta paracitricarpa TaxID=2016321 RepID=A0ABR1N3L6_9PEZI